MTEASHLDSVVQNFFLDLVHIIIYKCYAFVYRWPSHAEIVPMLRGKRTRLKLAELVLTRVFQNETACIRWLVFYRKCYPFLRLNQEVCPVCQGVWVHAASACGRVLRE